MTDIKRRPTTSDSEVLTCESKKMMTPKVEQPRQANFNSGTSLFSSSKKDQTDSDKRIRFFNSNKYDLFLEAEDDNATQWNNWAVAQRQSKDQGASDKLKYKSAFKLFKLDMIVQVKQEHPELDFKERLQYLKDLWKGLPKEEKCIFVQRSRLERDKAILKQKEEVLIQKLKEL